MCDWGEGLDFNCLVKPNWLLKFGRKLPPSGIIIGKYIEICIPDPGGMHILCFCLFVLFFKFMKNMITKHGVILEILFAV